MFLILSAVMVAVGIYTANSGVVMGEFLDRATPGLLHLLHKITATHVSPWLWDAVFVSMLSLAVWRFAFVLAFVFAVCAVVAQFRRGSIVPRLR